MASMRTVKNCPYAGCKWEYEERPVMLPGDTIEAAVSASILAMAQTTEAAIKAHLDADHTGWSLEGLQRMVQGQRLKQVMGIGPNEMFGPV